MKQSYFWMSTGIHGVFLLIYLSGYILPALGRGILLFDIIPITTTILYIFGILISISFFKNTNQTIGIFYPYVYPLILLLYAKFGSALFVFSAFSGGGGGFFFLIFFGVIIPILYTLFLFLKLQKTKK